MVREQFPVWLRFHGGKGVATAAGVVLALDARVFLATVLVFLIVLLLSRSRSGDGSGGSSGEPIG